MIKTPFVIGGVDANANPGYPVGAATKVGAVYPRQHSQADATLDCANFTSTIVFR